MKKLLALVMVFSIALPGRFARGTFSAVRSVPELQVLESTRAGMIFEFFSPDFSKSLTWLELGDRNYSSQYQLDYTSEAGKPRLPKVSFLIGVPASGQVELIVLEDEQRWIDSQQPLTLAPQPARLQADFGAGALETTPAMTLINNRLTSLFPETSLRVDQEAWLRNQRLIRIVLYPLQYDPLRDQLLWHQRLKFRVSFPSSLSKPTAATAGADIVGLDPLFDAPLRQNLLNYEVARDFQVNLNQAALRAGLSSARLADSTLAPGDGSYRIEVDQDGLYQLTYADLQAAGLDVANLDPTTIHLTSQGEAVAIFVENEDGDEHSFSPGENIYFYGQKFSGERLAQQYAQEASNYLAFSAQLPNGSPTVWQPQFSAEMLEKYTDTNVYWLSLESTPGVRMQVVDGTPHDVYPIPPSYPARAHAEQSNHWYTHNFTSEDTWYWDRIQNTTQRAYGVNLNALATQPFTAILRGEMAARASNAYYNPDHHTKLFFNSPTNMVEDAFWDGISRRRFEISLPSAQLVEGANTLYLSLYFDAYIGQLSDWVYFDWFEIDYQRRFVAENDQLTYSREESGSRWQYQIENITSPGMLILDTTNPLAPAWITNAQLRGSAWAFEAGHSGTASYLVTGVNAVRAPKDIAYYQPPNLLSPTNQYDYLFITHADFVTATQALADFRAAQGLRTLIVDVNDLYNLFNYGIYHSIAIKNFLAYTFSHWASPPSYVLLIGDGHWNFKASPAYNAPPIYMPPHLGWVDPWQGELDSSNLLAAVVGNDPLPDLFIGRLPVNSPAELSAAVTKIINYESAGLQNFHRRLLFIADNVPDPAGDFVAASEGIIGDYVNPGFQVERIYQNAYNCPPQCANVTSAILNTLNTNGALLVNFAGHGGVNRWSHEAILTTAHVPSLSNATLLPVIVSITCLDGYWLHPGEVPYPFPSLIEELVRAQSKGAVSAFAPVGLGVATGHDNLWRGFYQALFSDGDWSLGEAALSAKLRVYASGSNIDLVHTYTIFGDPALQIKSPYRFDLTHVPPGETDLPGSVFEYTLSLRNTGLVSDTYRVEISGNQWVLTAPEFVGPVAPGAQAELAVSIYSSLYLPNGSSDTVNIRLISLGDQQDFANAQITSVISTTFEWRLTHAPLIVK